MQGRLRRKPFTTEITEEHGGNTKYYRAISKSVQATAPLDSRGRLSLHCRWYGIQLCSGDSIYENALGLGLCGGQASLNWNF